MAPCNPLPLLDIPREAIGEHFINGGCGMSLMGCLAGWGSQERNWVTGGVCEKKAGKQGGLKIYLGLS